MSIPSFAGLSSRHAKEEIIRRCFSGYSRDNSAPSQSAPEVALFENNETKDDEVVLSICKESTAEINDNAQPTANNSDSNNIVQTNEPKEEEIDWSALQVEGKGINIYNLLTKIFNGVISSSTVKDVLKNGTDEEKAIVAKLYGSTEYKYQIGGMTGTAIGSMTSTAVTGGIHGNLRGQATEVKATEAEANNLYKIARWDANGDGFLSDNEIENAKHRKYTEEQGITLSTIKNELKKDDRTCGPSNLKAFAQTTVNGKKVYLASSDVYNGQDGVIALTEDEMNILDKYFGDENWVNNHVGNEYRGRNIFEAMEAIGGKALKGGLYYTLTNSAGISSKFYLTAGCDWCDEREYSVYKAIKAAMELDNK